MKNEDGLLLRAVVVELMKQRRPCSLQRITSLISGVPLSIAQPKNPNSDLASSAYARALDSQKVLDDRDHASRLGALLADAVSQGLLSLDCEKELYSVTTEGKRWAVELEKSFGAIVLKMRDELYIASQACKILARGDRSIHRNELYEELLSAVSAAASPSARPLQKLSRGRFERGFKFAQERGWIRVLDGKCHLTQQGREEGLEYA